jgi:sugar/nucleoside kinase (ribokinase family)
MNFGMKKIDFLAIGDIMSDAFIRLHQAHLIDAVDHVNKEICFSFGDKIPYEFVKVVPASGNSANTAISVARLGLMSAVVADIGKDQNGKECLVGLKKNGVITKYVHVHKKIDSNYHYILWYGSERTILIRHHEFPYVLDKIRKEPRWIYLTSLGEHSLPFHSEISKYLDTHREVKLAFQPGTWQIKFGKEALASIYKRTTAFFCNVEEARRILNDETSDVVTMMKAIHALGPQTVIITDGVKGSYVLENDIAYFMPIYPDNKPAYERTGAGDAFSSAVIAGLIYGKTLQEALLWGPINSMSVVRYVGAQEGLLSQEKIAEYLKNAPADYVLKKI